VTKLRAESCEPLQIDERPHDVSGTAKGRTFRTLEYDEYKLPHAIEATDAEGWICIYVVVEQGGEIGRWKSE